MSTTQNDSPEPEEESAERHDGIEQAREVSFPMEYIAVAEQLVATAVRSVIIYIPDLDSENYASRSFADTLSTMVRSGRQSRCRIMLNSEEGLARSQSPLLELGRKLPSRCQIKLTSQPPAKFEQDFIVVDTRCLMFRKSEQEKLAWFDPDAAAEAAQRIEHFNYLWDRAKTSPALRQLSI